MIIESDTYYYKQVCYSSSKIILYPIFILDDAPSQPVDNKPSKNIVRKRKAGLTKIQGQINSQYYETV